MSISSEISRISQNVSDSLSAVAAKGVSVPSGSTSDDLPTLISSIPTGGGGAHEVPDGYTQLKYLQSSGTQIINTAFAPTLETKLQVTGVRMPEQSGYNRIAGCNDPVVYIPMGSGVYSPTFYCRFGNSSETTTTSVIPVGTIGPPTITVDKTQAVFEADGVTKSKAIGATGMGTVDPDTRIALFGSYKGSSIHQYTLARIFRAKIWDDGVLVRDMLPAKRDSDDVLGMYDIVNDVFYTNAGTGVFTGGEYE